MFLPWIIWCSNLTKHDLFQGWVNITTPYYTHTDFLDYLDNHQHRLSFILLFKTFKKTSSQIDRYQRVSDCDFFCGSLYFAAANSITDTFTIFMHLTLRLKLISRIAIRCIVLDIWACDHQHLLIYNCFDDMGRVIQLYDNIVVAEKQR